MVLNNKGRKLGFAASMIGTAMFAISLSSSAAEEMDHSQHAGMDHSQHAGMDHSQHAQAVSHEHHAHGKGEWMIEFRWMRMEMEDLLDGDNNVDVVDVIGTMMSPGAYMMAPTEMTMDMKMLMVMYGFTDKISGMVMVNHIDNEMDMVNRMGVASSMDTSGLGDTQVGAMYNIDNNMTAGLMLSIPTGDIDEKVQMMGNTVQAPYAMQLGSGTYDLIPSIQYTSTSGMWTFGGQAEYTYRIGENDNDYTLGNKIKLSGWGKYAIDKTWNVAGRLDYIKQDEIDGQDSKIMNPMMAPTLDPANTGGKRIDLTLDATAAFGAHTVGLGYTVPVQQDVNGIQMELQSIVTLSYMYMM